MTLVTTRRERKLSQHWFARIGIHGFLSQFEGEAFPPAHPHQSLIQNQHQKLEKLSTWFWNVYKWKDDIFPIDWWFFYYKLCNETNFSYFFEFLFVSSPRKSDRSETKTLHLSLCLLPQVVDYLDDEELKSICDCMEMKWFEWRVREAFVRIHKQKIVCRRDNKGDVEQMGFYDAASRSNNTILRLNCNNVSLPEWTLGTVQTTTEIIFHFSPFFEQQWLTLVLLSLFVISIPQNEMKMTVKKVSLINFNPTKDTQLYVRTWVQYCLRKLPDRVRER